MKKNWKWSSFNAEMMPKNLFGVVSDSPGWFGY